MIPFRPARTAAATLAVILFSATLLQADPAVPAGGALVTAAAEGFTCHPRSGACKRNQTLAPAQSRAAADFACKPRAGACTRSQNAVAPANATALETTGDAACRPRAGHCTTVLR